MPRRGALGPGPALAVLALVAACLVPAQPATIARDTAPLRYAATPAAHPSTGSHPAADLRTDDLARRLTRAPVRMGPAQRTLFSDPYRAFSRQRGRRPWWKRPSGITGTAWVYPYFPRVCYQADRAEGGAAASAWQVLWVYPDSRPDNSWRYRRDINVMVRGAQSLFAASARRYLTDQQDVLSRSLAPRFVTTTGCRVDVLPVPVPAAVYNTGHVWDASSLGTPFGPGTLTDWLSSHGFDAPNRKYLVLLQSSPTYDHLWNGISDNPASYGSSASTETPTLDNPSNYTSFSYVDLYWFYLTGRDTFADLTYPTRVAAHEMTHALGAMTASAPHENASNPQHPTDCWDLLCYDAPTPGQTYGNGCGDVSGWRERTLALGYLRLDCNRDDYWAPATDSGLPAAAWTKQRWAVSSSSFLYGNPQPSAAQLAAHEG